MRCSSPCTRTCGGVSMAMCRSEPFRSTVIFKSSGSVAISGFLTPNPQSPVPNPYRSLDSLPDDFLDRRHTVLDLAQPAGAQRQHPLVDRLAAQLESRGADEDQLAQLLADRHHLVQADATLVARAV